MHGVERTGVRFVLSNAADPNRADEYSAWYDTYGAGITRPGFLANAFRFENPSAAGNDDDPRYAAIYDIVTPEEADPTLGRISPSSPIGRSLLGHEEGEVVEVKVPSGTREYEILKLVTIHDQAEGAR